MTVRELAFRLAVVGTYVAIVLLLGLIGHNIATVVYGDDAWSFTAYTAFGAVFGVAGFAWQEAGRESDRRR
ncbi:hypothetical protein GS538_20485 [Rhodococcus hoagii]|nr:hypothetical protein [Prescottella equi]NKR94306.1 hypothetical protein [Prescottella equi]